MADTATNSRLQFVQQKVPIFVKISQLDDSWCNMLCGGDC